MPVNEPKTAPTVEELFSTLLTGLIAPKEEDTTDPVKEIFRLLKKAEESDYNDETNRLLQLVDRHIKIVELGLAYQK